TISSLAIASPASDPEISTRAAFATPWNSPPRLMDKELHSRSASPSVPSTKIDPAVWNLPAVRTPRPITMSSVLAYASAVDFAATPPTDLESTFTVLMAAPTPVSGKHHGRHTARFKLPLRARKIRNESILVPRLIGAHAPCREEISDEPRLDRHPPSRSPPPGSSAKAASRRNAR